MPGEIFTMSLNIDETKQSHNSLAENELHDLKHMLMREITKLRRATKDLGCSISSGAMRRL